MKRPRGSVTGPAALRALASPARQEIIDTLEALGGEAPVAALAAQLGRPSDGLYYHLRLLVRAGLLVKLENGELEDGGRGRRYRVATGEGRLRLRYRPGTPAAGAMRRVTDAMLRTARRDFAAALRDPRSAVDGAGRTLWASRTKGWVGPAELAAVNRLLERLIDVLQRGPGKRRRQLLSLTWVVAPVPARPPRRG